jgi:hypothetical protein
LSLHQTYLTGVQRLSEMAEQGHQQIIDDYEAALDRLSDQIVEDS